jgi:hypothetical protein
VSADNAVLIASIVGEAVVCGLVVRRKMWRTLPFFCVFFVWALVSDLASFIIQWKMSAFFFGRYYFSQAFVDAFLQVTVLVELAWSVLQPLRKSLPRGALVILIALIALCGLAIWPLAGMSMPPDLTWRSAVLFQLQETVGILRVACFLLMASFSQVLSIGWRDRELQIATGLGFYSIVSLLVTLIHSHQTWSAQYHWLDLASSIGYLGSLTYWVFAFASKEQKRKEFSPQMQQLLLLMGGGARADRIALSDISSERSKKRNR